MASSCPNGDGEYQASRGATAQTAVVAVATAGKTMPHPAPTLWLTRFSTSPRKAPAAKVAANQSSPGTRPTVATTPTAQLTMII
ncbi:hypothetical protein D3C85_1625160 [compost metagenome]